MVLIAADVMELIPSKQWLRTFLIAATDGLWVDYDRCWVIG